jgi:hypothetical protein
MQVATKDLELKDIPETLKEIYKLIKPLNRSYIPMGVDKMIELQILPKTYKGYEDISEEDAKTTWKKLTEQHPELKVVEGIPLNELSCKKHTWHEQLLIKIHAYNEHSAQVVYANKAIADEEDYQETVTEEQYKKAKEDHAKRLDKFWSTADPAGAFAIERSEMIRRKKCESTEKAAEQPAEK